MKQVLATDLDGTLFYPRRLFTLIPKKNIKFLREYIDSNGKVVLITGRSLLFAKKVEEKLERKIDFITCNSTQISIDDKLIKNVYLKQEDIDLVFDYLNKEFDPIAYIMMTEEYPVVVSPRRTNPFLRIGYKIYYSCQFSYRENYVFSNKIFDAELKNGKIHKLMVFVGLRKKYVLQNKELNKILRQKFPNLEFSWSNQIIEVTPVNCEKSNGLKDYLKHVGVEEDDAIVVGDSGNDISMFNAFKNSVCMAHAPSTVRKYANNVVKKYPDLANYIYDKDEKEKNNE